MLAWNALKQQWSLLNGAESDGFVISSALRAIVSSLPATQAYYNEASSFFASASPIPGTSSAIQSGLAQLNANVNWLEQHGSEFLLYFS